MKISAVVLTKDEEKNIERCLKSLSFCNEIIVIDDYSTDKTIEKVQSSKFKLQIKSKIQIFGKKLNKDFAAQRNFGMSRASNEWILFVDADEVVSKELAKEIVKLLNGYIVKENAYYIRRRDFFWGKELKYGELRRIRQMGLIRLLKKDSGKWLGNVHEEFKVKSQKSKVKSLNSFLNHYPHQTLKEFIQDVNYYSSLRAKKLYNQGKSVNILEIIIWPLGKFISNFLINLGFLDGAAGFAYAFLMSFHSFLVRAKLYMKKLDTVPLSGRHLRFFNR